jgi:hypothetical protein
MVNRNLIRSLEDDSILTEVDNLLSVDDLDEMILPTLEDLNQQFDVNQIVSGKTWDSRAKVPSTSMNGRVTRSSPK